MDSNFDFTIPETLRDIKLSQWQRYIEILEKNKDAELTGFLEKKLLGIFCGVELKDIDRIGLSVFDNTIQHLSNILNSKPELVKTFKMTGTDDVTVEFGLIPNFDKMSYGEFVDLEKYLFVDKDLHRAMAVMYRPVKLKSKGSYLIHDYNGTEYLAEVMKNTPLDVALSARVFFYRLATKLSNFTMAYTLKELQQKQEGRKDKHSVKSGETIKQYLRSLEKMSEELEKLQNYQYTNV
jgi:hypothetical protein|tara:strand:- start:1128 stop:1838 length:711 start_codon:yes stop_codon:yes gene_type:complete